MDSAQLEERARQAEEAIEFLKNRLESLNAKAASLGIGKECDEVWRLRSENDVLQAEVDGLKKELNDLEAQNKSPQVPLPRPGSKPPVYNEPPPINAYVGTGLTNESISFESPVAAAKPPAPAPSNPVTVDDKSTGKKAVKKPAKKKEPSPQPPERPVDVSRLNIRVGKILSVRKHPEADTLFVEEVDIGEEKPRTVCSGLVPFMPIENVQDRVAIFLCNLKTVKMRGIPSEAMIMCAEDGKKGKCEIICPPEGSQIGDRVTCEKYPGEPDSILNTKKKIWEKIQADLRSTDDCIPAYKGDPFIVKGKGVCRVPTLFNTIIK